MKVIPNVTSLHFCRALREAIESAAVKKREPINKHRVEKRHRGRARLGSSWNVRMCITCRTYSFSRLTLSSWKLRRTLQGVKLGGSWERAHARYQEELCVIGAKKEWRRWFHWARAESPAPQSGARAPSFCLASDGTPQLGQSWAV